MTAFTMRLDDVLAKQLEKICAQKGYSRTGLIKALIRDFIASQTKEKTKKKSSITSLVGMTTLGGDAIEDSEDYFS